MLEVLVAGANMEGVGKGSILGAWLAGEATEPGDPLAGRVANGRPEGPTTRSGLDGELVDAEGGDNLA
jgi:hypothetical protein